MTRDEGMLDALQRAHDELAENGPLATDGIWLEDLTVDIGPALADWDVEVIYPWGAWPEREEHFPQSTANDDGIDLVARRRSDGAHIAVQCKSRQLDDTGRGRDIGKDEFDSFSSHSSSSFWSERWLIANGSVRLSDPATRSNQMSDQPVKLVNLAADVSAAAQIMEQEGDCAHCAHPGGDGPQTRSCMQREAVERSVRLLREHADADTGGRPIGEARGRIILPCGTGKTRVALRITETLASAGELSVVLCPSIALVAQIRREFLNHASVAIRALAVCSDETAGYDPTNEGVAKHDDDPTRDTSNVSASDIKGRVTTDAAEIARWISEGGSDDISVIFGTYQSARRVAEAIEASGAAVTLLVCDEAHRTASLRRKRNAVPDEDAKLREFTLCHDQQAFPARYRVYQTATPRIYNHANSTRRVDPGEFVVRSMDDETTFGVELYRRSYVDAVRNGWLADYRIIALGVSDPDAYRIANDLARDAGGSGRHKLTTVDHIRGLALAGGTRTDDERNVCVNSCIAFMNTVNKSKNLAANLQTDAVRGWLAERLADREPALFTLEHLDATSNVAQRDNAKQRLAEADSDAPHGIVNVGIFGEGTDSPSLSSVAFLEPRRSPIDVVQAVGRAMRTSPGKELGYVICPILIPPSADPEQWLSTARPDEGWSELGQILLALRAHDERIENELAGLLKIFVPSADEVPQVTSMVSVPSRSTGRIRHGEHTGAPGAVFDVVEAAAADDGPLSHHGISPLAPERWTPATEPTAVLIARPRSDGTVELRQDSPERDRPASGDVRGRVNVERTKRRARKMINDGQGRPLPSAAERRRRSEQARQRKRERGEEHAQQMLDLVSSAVGDDITVNLLARSGLRRDRVARDLNILEASVNEAAFHLRRDELQPALDAHFGLDHLAADKRSGQADGCTVAALLLMNAAMLHQRIAAGGWLRGIEPLAAIKNSTDPIRRCAQNWERITRQDFVPVVAPAREAVYAVERTGRLAGLERALRHLAAEAERIAATYADMGADHAGPLFNKVMGNQASDGAFFTRPPAATMAARLALDACSRSGALTAGSSSAGHGRADADWTDPQTWREHRAVDLACGSGTLLAALLAEMKRRAAVQGATNALLAELQRVAVEDVLAGMDINPVSLQLAATQLTAGNADIKYRRMGLYQMPYGPTGDAVVPTAAGTLELLAEESVLPNDEAQLFASAAQGAALEMSLDTPQSLNDPDIREAADAAVGARIAIMNPPFTERERMGQKFPKEAQRLLRSRVDGLEGSLVAADPTLAGFVTKRALRPMFVALADRCIASRNGVLAMVVPTVALASHSGGREREVLASRFDVDTVLTCHQPGNINLSQNTNINESIVVMRRRATAATPPPRDSSISTAFRRTTPRLSICSTPSTASTPLATARWRTAGVKSRIGPLNAFAAATGPPPSGARRHSPRPLRALPSITPSSRSAKVPCLHTCSAHL